MFMQKLSIIFLAVLVLISAFIIYSKQGQISLMENQISELQNKMQEQSEELKITKNELSSVKDQYREEFSKNYNLTQELNKIKPFYDYCDQHFVFVVSKTKLYHKPSCYYVQDGKSSFTAYTITTAKQKGYSPCWLCCQ